MEGQAGVAKREAQVVLELKRLGDAVERLRSKQSILIDRLNPVMRPEPSVDPSLKNTEECVLCEIAGVVHSSTTVIEGMAEGVDNTLDKLEL